jgi:hypothetical protein
MLAAASSKIWSFLQPPPYFPLLYCFAIVRMIVRSLRLDHLLVFREPRASMAGAQ